MSFEGLEFRMVALDHILKEKGSASYASSGLTVSPSIVFVCLYAQWSMGFVMEQYLHYEKAGDQYLGWVVGGLNCS